MLDYKDFEQIGNEIQSFAFSKLQLYNTNDNFEQYSDDYGN